MSDKAGWEVEGFIKRLLARPSDNDERLVLEACSHLREFSKQDTHLRAEIERLRAREAELVAALQWYAGPLFPESRLTDNGERARAALAKGAQT